MLKSKTRSYISAFYRKMIATEPSMVATLQASGPKRFIEVIFINEPGSHHIDDDPDFEQAVQDVHSSPENVSQAIRVMAGLMGMA